MRSRTISECVFKEICHKSQKMHFLFSYSKPLCYSTLLLSNRKLFTRQNPLWTFIRIFIWLLRLRTMSGHCQEIVLKNVPFVMNTRYFTLLDGCQCSVYSTTFRAQSNMLYVLYCILQYDTTVSYTHLTLPTKA